MRLFWEFRALDELGDVEIEKCEEGKIKKVCVWIKLLLPPGSIAPGGNGKSIEADGERCHHGRMNEEDRAITTKRHYAPAFDAWITSSV